LQGKNELSLKGHRNQRLLLAGGSKAAPCKNSYMIEVNAEPLLTFLLAVAATIQSFLAAERKPFERTLH